MTRRILLGVTNGFGDFMGIIEPCTIRFKLMMKKFFECESPMMWDQPIDGPFKDSWIELIAEAVKTEMMIFPRKARPENSVGRPRVVGFGDGAFPSFGGCVYLVWAYICDTPGKCGQGCDRFVQGADVPAQHAVDDSGSLALHVADDTSVAQLDGEDGAVEKS